MMLCPFSERTEHRFESYADMPSLGRSRSSGEKREGTSKKKKKKMGARAVRSENRYFLTLLRKAEEDAGSLSVGGHSPEFTCSVRQGPSQSGLGTLVIHT